MKLENMNRLDEALGLSRQNAIIEGILSDFVASKVSQFQSWVSGHNKEVEQLGLSGFIKAAKDLDVSLLDDRPEADEWWKSLVTMIDKKQGGHATWRQRAEIVANAKAKIDLVINRDLEDARDRLEQLVSARDSNADVDKLFDTLFGGRTPKSGRKTRREYATEGKINEGLGRTISNALDMLDPKKRIRLGSAMIRSSNNARIAAIAIPMIAKKLDMLNVGKRFTKRKPTKKPLEQARYEIATFINNCMTNSSQAKHKGKSQAYWLGRIRAKAKQLGYRIDMEQLPTQPLDLEKYKPEEPH